MFEATVKYSQKNPIYDRIHLLAICQLPPSNINVQITFIQQLQNYWHSDKY